MQLKTLFFLGCAAFTVPALNATAVAAEKYSALVERLAAQPPQGVAYRAELEQQLFAMVNAERRKKGAHQLKVSGSYKNAARAHAAELLQGGRMNHRASTGQNFESRMRALNPGKVFMLRLAENAARVRRTKLNDQQKLADIIKQWRGSGSHRQTMLSLDYVSMATGVAEKTA
jgi:uncharacterized protein YkwD